jgi:hypothetical protein
MTTERVDAGSTNVDGRHARDARCVHANGGSTRASSSTATRGDDDATRGDARG